MTKRIFNNGGYAILGLLSLSCATDAMAQMSSSNCMAMGGGMIQCNTMDMSTGGYNQAPDSGAALGQGIGALIARAREDSFKKKIGTMLSNGDCQGAAKYALEKGRIELGSQIAQVCQPATPQVAQRGPVQLSANELPAALQRIATNAKTPFALDELTTVTKIEAIGTQLLLNATIDAVDVQMTTDARSAVVNDICAFDGVSTLMRSGASVRLIYTEKSGRSIGSVMANRQDCGI